MKQLAHLISKKELRRFLNRAIFDHFGMHLKSVPSAELLKVERFDFEDEALKLIEKVRGYTMISHTRLVTLYQQVRYIEQNKLEGDFVECGVWRGGAAAMIGLSQMDSGCSPRRIHLFDSFEGLPEATEKDSERDIKWLGKQALDSAEHSGHLIAGESYVQELFDKCGYPCEFIIIYKGWVEETIPKAIRQNKIEKIALLHLDVDLYQSYKVCLQHLWDLIVPRGIIIIDDYKYFQGCERAVTEFFNTQPFIPLLNHIHRGGARYIIKP